MNLHVQISEMIQSQLDALTRKAACAEGGLRDQNAWNNPDWAGPVRSCLGRFHVHNQGKSRGHRTDSRYSRKDAQRTATAHRWRSGADWRRCAFGISQKGITFAGPRPV